MSVLLKKLGESEKKLFVGMAGPGAGKTTAFKEIIESENYKGKNILILSFINKLVDDLKTDFSGSINVTVLTLHSFAKRELAKKITDIDLDPDLDILASEDSAYIRNKELDYQAAFYNYNLNSEDYSFYRSRADFYKRKNPLHSFNSIIYELCNYFTEHDDEIPKYDLVLIDEFQDFNKLECELIKHLNTKSRVVIVGDDNQSLYSFKNALPQEIQALYQHEDTEPFSFDYCYRCTRVIVDSTNSLIENAKNEGFLANSYDKKFLYPEDPNHTKHEISEKYSLIDFIPCVTGDQLFYKIADNIRRYTSDNSTEKKRILIIAPGYLKQYLYEGLLSRGINVTEYELFSDEECNGLKHKRLFNVFETLALTKTDNLALRKVLSLYLTEELLTEILQRDKRIWFSLSKEMREKIDKDIELFKKVKKGKEKLSDKELVRFGNIFSLKNVLKKLVRGFDPVPLGSIEVEMTTVMSSKGLSAHAVYYVGIDDRNMFDYETKYINDQKICEFLVGITRAKEKLTLISLEDKEPKILDLIDSKYINIIDEK